MANFPTDIFIKAEDKEVSPVLNSEWDQDILEGARNSTITRFVGSLFAKGIDKKTVLLAANGLNTSKCKPPLSENEVRAIVNSISNAHYSKNKELTTRIEPEGITAYDLLNKKLPEMKWAILGILPEGLTILGGKPKTGKSWMALSIAIAIARGMKALGKMLTKMGDVLYLALEDGLRRLKDRIDRLLPIENFSYVSNEDGRGITIKSGCIPEGPRNLHIFTEWPRIGQGGIELMEKFLDNHPNTRLIVIDILLKIMPIKGRKSNYEEDYFSIEELKKLSQRRNVAILGLAHIRKAPSDDPYELINATLGLVGSADGVMVIMRQRKSNSASLFVGGRDIEEETEYAIEWGKESATWTIVSENAKEYFMSKARKEIYDFLKAKGPSSPKEIAETLGKNQSTTQGNLSHMLKDDEIKTNGNGKYYVE
ncbi:MAG: AAA family ATPase [Actinobacteria bacterium]|nr:AAA family ATPase [Actinomycetota bacterium]